MKNLYHSSVSWSKEFNEKAKPLLKSTNYSLHLWEHLLFGNIKHDISERTLNEIVDGISNNEIDYDLFEVEITDGEITKAVVRTEYDEKRDISIVYRKDLIVTAWLNFKDDSHFTLDYKKYSKVS